MNLIKRLEINLLARNEPGINISGVQVRVTTNKVLEGLLVVLKDFPRCLPDYQPKLINPVKP